MVADSLIVSLNKNGFYTVGYADDIIILLCRKFESILCDRMQSALKLIQTWCTNHCLSVNPEKTEMVLFTRKRKVGVLTPPKFMGVPLGFSLEVKYLGVTFDKKLLWETHLNNRMNKASIAFWQCRRALGQTWGLSPKVMMWIYTAVIRPMLTYGAVAWWPRTMLTTTRKKLAHTQRTACLSITGAMRTTPTAAMEVMLCLPPLDIYVKEVALASILRLQSVGVNRRKVIGAGQARRGLWEDACKRRPLLRAYADCAAPTYVYEKPYQIFLQQGTRQIEEGIGLYVDGSKTRKGSGAGLFSEELRLEISTPLGKCTTALQAEIIAVTLAAKTITDKKIQNKRIYIYTDSRQTLVALGRPKVTSKLLLDCHNALAAAAATNAVAIQWLKGHNNDLGNSRADGLARRGSGTALIGPEPFTAPAMPTLLEEIKSITHEDFLKRWDETRECHLARKTLYYPSKEKAQNYLNMSRRNLRLTIGLLTGHCQLRGHLYKMGLCNTPICRGCEQEDETLEHFLCECPMLESTRRFTLGVSWPNLTIIRETPPNTVLAYARAVGWLASQE